MIFAFFQSPVRQQILKSSVSHHQSVLKDMRKPAHDAHIITSAKVGWEFAKPDDAARRKRTRIKGNVLVTIGKLTKNADQTMIAVMTESARKRGVVR